MLVLAAHDDDSPMQTWQIAAASLARPAKEISFAGIVEIAGGFLALSACV
jgi:hypothetical protein